MVEGAFGPLDLNEAYASGGVDGEPVPAVLAVSAGTDYPSLIF